MSELPPLKALQYFDVAIRLNSFSAAAQQLFVTPGAVGQQIRKLEEWLGVALFTRHIRQVQPTAEGLAYWARIQPALAQIQQASRAIRDSRSTGVHLSMTPSLAAKWFAPRMSDFLTRHPEVALHLSSSSTIVDFGNDTVDLAIRHFNGQDPSVEAHLLYQDQASVYCSPDYAHALRLEKPADLQRATLLHSTWHPHWAQWLSTFANMPPAVSMLLSGVHFDQSLMVIEAAKLGQGVALACSLLTEREIADGSLIELFPQRLPLAKGYYLVHPHNEHLRPQVRALRDWLLQQASAH